MTAVVACTTPHHAASSTTSATSLYDNTTTIAPSARNGSLASEITLRLGDLPTGWQTATDRSPASGAPIVGILELCAYGHGDATTGQQLSELFTGPFGVSAVGLAIVTPSPSSAARALATVSGSQFSSCVSSAVRKITNGRLRAAAVTTTGLAPGGGARPASTTSISIAPGSSTQGQPSKVEVWWSQSGQSVEGVAMATPGRSDSALIGAMLQAMTGRAVKLVP
jgi:hypothetical protein